MLPFRKILFPVDFSERCRAIAPIVAQTVDKFGAELYLLHAVDPIPMVMSPIEPSITAAMPDFAELRRYQTERLHGFQREFFPGAKPTVIVEVGDAATLVRQFIRHQGVDLVMLPTHGRGGFRRFLLGSVAAKILHDVDCAVWTDAHRVEGQPAFPYRRILCSLDVNDEEAPAILRGACSIATTYGAELTLVHAAETPPAGWEGDYAAFRDDAVEAATKQMLSLRDATGVQAPFQIPFGFPDEEVRRVALKEHADLIVTGRGRAQTRLARIWSNLYSIIREAPCPVLSI